MKQLFLCIIFALPLFGKTQVIAQHKVLTVQQANCAGFRITRSNERYLALAYPALLDEKWAPIGVMVEFMIDDQSVFTSKTPFQAAKVNQPELSLGFYQGLNEQNDAQITISFQCVKGCDWPYAQTYTIPSVKALSAVNNSCDEMTGLN